MGPARDVATANAADIERAGGTWEARGLDWVYVLKYVSEIMRCVTIETMRERERERERL